MAKEGAIFDDDYEFGKNQLLMEDMKEEEELSEDEI